MNLKKTILFTSFVLISLFGFACSCDTQEFSYASENADEIFLGDIVKQEMIYEAKKMWNGVEYQNRHIETTFKVVKKWKGNSDMYIILQQESTCATPLEIQNYNPYIIYATYSMDTVLGISFNSSIWTYACTRNSSYSFYASENKDLDDRPRLDEKYSLIKLRNNKYDSLIGKIFLISLFIFIFYFVKKYKASSK